MADLSDDVPHVRPFGCREAAERHGIDAGDLESICDRYGHGDCYALTVAMHDRHGWDLRILQDRNGDSVHAVAVTPDGIHVDAYGAFVDAADILERWPDLDLSWRESDREEVSDIGMVDDEALLDAQAALDEPWPSLVAGALGFVSAGPPMR